MKTTRQEIIDILKADWQLSDELATALSTQSIFSVAVRKSKALKAIGRIHDTAPRLLCFSCEEREDFKTDETAQTFIDACLARFAEHPEDKPTKREMTRYEDRLCVDLRFKFAPVLDALFDEYSATHF